MMDSLKDLPYNEFGVCIAAVEAKTRTYTKLKPLMKGCDKVFRVGYLKTLGAKVVSITKKGQRYVVSRSV